MFPARGHFCGLEKKGGLNGKTEVPQFVTPITDTCTVCGYEVKSEQYETAYTVTFLDYDGTVLSTQQLCLNEDAQVPENPQRMGYSFIGWDKGFGSVVEDIKLKQKKYRKIQKQN